MIARHQTQELYSQIELEDLNDFQASEGIGLDMKNSQRYFESRAINEEDTSDRQKASVPQAFSELKGCLGDWERSLTQVRHALSPG